MHTSQKFILSLLILFCLGGFSCNSDFSNINPAVNSEQSIQKNLKSENFVKLNFLDVGQGDATLIDFPSGEQMLVDCGINARILPELGHVMKPFDREIDYLIVTHPDMDHYGGCVDVLERFKVDHIYFTSLKRSDNYWKYFWDLAHKEGDYTQVSSTAKLDIAGVKINFLYPDHDVIIDKKIPDEDKFSTDNETSIVFKLTFGESSVMFTGDADAVLEKYLLKKYKNELSATVLKVAHHGSAGSSSQEFLDAVQPQISSISVGKDNKYKHPSLRTIKRLERVGTEILRTDEKGDIILRMYEDGEIVQ